MEYKIDDIISELNAVVPLGVSVKKSYLPTKRGFPNSCIVSTENSKELDTVEFNKLLKTYQKRCVQRLTTFLGESKRMSVKVQEVFTKLKELEVEIISMDIDQNFSERITNKRKRPRGLKVEITAKKKNTNLYGALFITPSSLKMYLGSDTLASGVPIYSITYYRNLMVHDNYLAALVKGASIYGKRRFF
jgi:hypothetical protein